MKEVKRWNPADVMVRDSADGPFEYGLQNVSYVLASDHDSIVKELHKALDERDAIAALGEKGWQPWNPNLPLPPDGEYLTTVCGRGYRGPFLSFTKPQRFREDDVLAYWSSPLPKPYSPSPPIGEKEAK